MLTLKNIQLSIDDQHVIDDVSLTLDENRIACLLGPSGSGKTTLLQCIAGFRRPDSGQIIIRNTIVDDASMHVATEKRRLGMVFQDYTLFPHLSVTENIGFGIHYLSSSQRAKVVDHLLKLTSMSRYANRYPHELSGGQQQRIALARALAPDPQLLLLDEPFSNLDASLKLQLIGEMREILIEKGITALMVTHDQEEALTMSDMLGVMHDGKLLQWDSAYNIYHQPQSIDIATSVGIGETILGEIDQQRTVHTALGKFDLSRSSNVPDLANQVRVLIRPDDIIHNDLSLIHISEPTRPY